MTKKYHLVDVTLSANTSHYIYTAIALQKANYLKRFICSVGFDRNALRLSSKLPERWQPKIKARDYSEIKSELMKSIWLAELVQKSLPALGLISGNRGNWLNNQVYDYLSSFFVRDCKIFHFENGLGLYTAKKVKSKGGVLVCDVRTEYPDYQFSILEDEYQFLGAQYNPPGIMSRERFIAEYDIADYLIVPSSYAKRTFIEAGYPADKLYVIPYGVDRTQFFVVDNRDVNKSKYNENNADDKFRVIYVGTILPRKGIRYLIDAFTQLNLKNSELLLVGYIDEVMKTYIKTVLQKTPNIRHVNNIPKANLFEYYNQASVFVLPSLADSWGLVVLEAMACGLPVIVTENTGSNEAVIDGENGFILPIRNSELIFQKLLYLHENQEKRLEMSKAAINTSTEFTWERYEDLVIAMYARIMEK
jgi:alpha-maltose-1-phosphate synthase